jgi:hypothetical protein
MKKSEREKVVNRKRKRQKEGHEKEGIDALKEGSLSRKCDKRWGKRRKKEETYKRR